MIVCVCRAVRCRDIDRALDEGASTVREIGLACGAGRDCGACAADLRARLAARGMAAESSESQPDVEVLLAAK